MIESDSKGLLYADVIGRNIQRLFIMGIDLKKYFESPIAFHKISSEQYKEYHPNETSELVGSNLNILKDICESYDNVLGCKILESDVKEIYDINGVKQQQQLHQIEYYSVGLKHTLPKEKWCKTIQEVANNDISYLEIPYLQTIVQFKWQTYTR